MRESTALLISEDPTLIKNVQGVIDSISGLRLDVKSEMLEALPEINEGEFPLVLIHAVRAEDGEQVADLLRLLSNLKHPAATVVLAEEHRPEEALSLLRQGVADYLARPLDLNRLAYLADTLTVRCRYAEPAPSRASSRVRRLGTREPFFYLDSAAMGMLMEQVQLVAPQEATLLLGGETGTGKTRLARLIHELSPRANEPFLAVNCGALPENLIESELFGHVRGSFTSADRDRVGKFAAAGNGTILLDEIDALPLGLQAKFLRAIDEKVFEPLGSNMPTALNARIITASNRSLEKEVESGRFRSDLYYRLNVVGFYLPPLRERKTTIPHLVSHFVTDAALRNRRNVRGIADDALEAMLNYDWPGNIRELRNVLERAVALSPAREIRLADLPDGVLASSPNLARTIHTAGPAPKRTLKTAKGEAEVSWILRALDKHGNNRLRAAAELGISRMTLYKKMHRYGLIGAT